MPSLTITIEDSSPLISYSSGWVAGASVDSAADLYSQSSFTVTEARGSSASFTFNGTSVEIFGAKRGNHGLYQVKLDDTLYPPVSGKAADPGQFQEPLFSNTTLNQGLHHLALINYENAYLDVDFITWQTQIGTDQEKLFVNIFQDTDPSFTYFPSEASWMTNPQNLGSFLGGTGHATVSSEAYCVYKFSGNTWSLFKRFGPDVLNNILGEGISLYGPVGPNGSAFGAQLDGGPIISFTSNKRFYTPQILLYHTNSLDPGPHQLKLLYQPTTPNQVFAIDYAAVFTSSPSPFSNTIPLRPHQSSGLTSLTVGTITGMVVSVVLLLAFLSCFLYQRRRWINNKNPQNNPGVEPYMPQTVSQGFVTTSAVPGTIPRPFMLNSSTPGLHMVAVNSHMRNKPSHSSLSSGDPLLRSTPRLNSSTSRSTLTPFSPADGHTESFGAVPRTFQVPADNEGLPPDYSQAMRPQ